MGLLQKFMIAWEYLEKSTLINEFFGDCKIFNSEAVIFLCMSLFMFHVNWFPNFGVKDPLRLTSSLVRKFMS